MSLADERGTRESSESIACWLVKVRRAGLDVTALAISHKKVEEEVTFSQGEKPGQNSKGETDRHEQI